MLDPYSKEKDLLTPLLRAEQWIQQPLTPKGIGLPEDIWGTQNHRLNILTLSCITHNAICLNGREGSIIVFLLEGEDAETGEYIGLLFDVAFEAKRLSQQSYADICEAVINHAKKRCWKHVIVRLFPTEDSLLRRDHPVHITSRIRKQLPPDVAMSDTGLLTIHPARSTDTAVCLEMIQDALIAGNVYNKLKPTSQAIRDSALRILQNVQMQDGLHLVASIKDEVVGHAIGLVKSECEKTGIIEGELLDTFTREKYRKRGFAARLTAYWEAELIRQGVKSCRGSVSGPRREIILKNLYMQGWHEFTREWKMFSRD